MRRRESRCLWLCGRKKAFTLLELLLAMAIGSVLIGLLTQLFLSGLYGASTFSQKMNRDHDFNFALNSMIDELLAADEIYKIQDHAIQFYVREKGTGGHKVVSYVLEDSTLSRYGDHDHIKYDKENLKLRRGTRTVILSDVEELQFHRAGEHLSIHLKCGKTCDRIVALRGSYE